MNKSLINKESLCPLQRIPKMCTNIRRNAGIEAQKWCLWNFLELWLPKARAALGAGWQIGTSRRSGRRGRREQGATQEKRCRKGRRAFCPVRRQIPNRGLAGPVALLPHRPQWRQMPLPLAGAVADMAGRHVAGCCRRPRCPGKPAAWGTAAQYAHARGHSLLRFLHFSL